ncbi:hypothetical protein Sme01_04160 [Sphaerisporangium melleum]|uniref:Uncharacterized protein n=1 Tax=Sphaerisporangium melleum TaxID=321316 RepID=A0A917QPR0_9ACTN|nr:hypothetical protein [Sphaerisporangium melleum]GGK62204.1 hypothetical protein GCM10007964_01710 [Sphaerisporangium melleum]GII67940.1 hypothetical protein Sme01_04160 [Sphaerisporangium melleum]
MAELEVGATYDITIKGARAINLFGTKRDGIDTGTVLVFRVPGSKDDRTHTVNMGDPGVTVARAAPANWPPQVGDKWHDGEGRPWFALAHVVPFGAVWMYRADRAEDCSPEDFKDSLGPVVLVHREEKAGGEPCG